MKRVFQIAGIVFLLFVFTFVALFFLLPKEEYSATEKRYLAEMPDLNIDTLSSGSFMSDFSSYAADHFPFRASFMRIRTTVSLWLNDRESEGVYYGDGGVLIERFPGEASEKRTAKVTAMNEFRARYPKTRFTVMLAPTAVTVEQKSLPLNAPIGAESAYIDAVYEELDGFEKIDLRPVFEANTGDYELYYRTDHHWTTKGALLAAKEYAGDVFGAVQLSPVTHSFIGSLAAKSGFTAKEADTIFVPLLPAGFPYVVTDVSGGEKRTSCYHTEALTGDDPYQVFFGGNAPLIKIETAADSEKRLLIIKDSYANSLVPFLLPLYKEIVLVDPRYYYDDIDALMFGGFDEVLFLYNAITFSEDTALPSVLCPSGK